MGWGGGQRHDGRVTLQYQRDQADFQLSRYTGFIGFKSSAHAGANGRFAEKPALIGLTFHCAFGIAILEVGTPSLPNHHGP